MDEKILNLQKLYDNINTRISLLENNMLSILSNSQNNTINTTLTPTHTNNMYGDNNTSTQSVSTTDTDEIIPKKKKDNILRKRASARHTIY